MISPTLFHFLYMYTLLVKKKMFCQTKLVSRRKHLLQHAMRFAVNEKITYCEKKINSKFFLLKLLISMLVSTNFWSCVKAL